MTHVRLSRRAAAIIILILGALTTISPFAIDMYLPAFPQIAKEMDVPVASISLSLSSYFIGLAIGQLFYGPVLDRFGRKLPLYFGLSLFVVASIGCMFATDVETLIVLRFVQALGGCAAQVASTAMVRDFFPVDESAKVFSLIILVLSVSPLLAPTFGTFIMLWLGWKAVFAILAGIVVAIALVVFFFLPEGHKPDKTISLRPAAITRGYFAILKDAQFHTYALTGAFSFTSLFVYVASSPLIFLDVYKVDTTFYGGIFAFLSIGFIGGSQLNIQLLKRFRGEDIFRGALIAQVLVAGFFLTGTLCGWFGLYSTIAVLFALLSTLGLIAPNATAIALAPFGKNAGSASALIGCIQIGVAALASAGVGILTAANPVLPPAGLMLGGALVAVCVLFIGKREMRKRRG